MSFRGFEELSFVFAPPGLIFCALSFLKEPWTVHGHGPSMAMDRPGPEGTPFTIQEYHTVYYTRIPRRLLYKNTTPFTIQANHTNTIQANRANILGASRRLLT